MASTKQRLAERLRSIGLPHLADRAIAGEWSDFETSHACPKVELVGALSRIYKTSTDLKKAQLAYNLAKEVMEGKFDDTHEEAEAWAASKEGQETFEKLKRNGP